MSWMMWVAGILSALLFVYLVYALLYAEDLE
jgi:K+-transporting ATPase KdpF subunit